MKKYKLLYFVSEDEYFISHKIDQAISGFKVFNEITIISRFSKYSNKIKSSGFRTKNIKFNRRSVNLLQNFKVFLNYFFFVNRYKPSVIQCFALKPILYAVIANFFSRNNTKLLCCVVGMGYLFINKNLFTRLYKNLFFMFLRSCINRNVFFIFQNKDDLSIFQKKRILGNNIPIIIQGSGVLTKKFTEGKQKKIYDLIFHSRIIKDKGIFEIIDALKILRNKNINLKALILGDPDDKNRSTVTQNQLDLWVKENLIIWKSKVKNVIPFLQKSKISILPSYREGLPKGLLEAASCKLPLISTNVPGCREICKNNFNGFLVKPKDSESLAKSIERLIFDERLMKKFGANSRKLVQQRFSADIVFKNFLGVYREVLKKAP